MDCVWFCLLDWLVWLIHLWSYILTDFGFRRQTQSNLQGSCPPYNPPSELHRRQMRKISTTAASIQWFTCIVTNQLLTQTQSAYVSNRVSEQYVFINCIFQPTCLNLRIPDMVTWTVFNQLFCSTTRNALFSCGFFVYKWVKCIYMYID